MVEKLWPGVPLSNATQQACKWTIFNEKSEIVKSVHEELKKNPVQKYLDSDDDYFGQIEVEQYISREGGVIMEIDQRARVESEELKCLYEKSIDKYLECFCTHSPKRLTRLTTGYFCRVIAGSRRNLCVRLVYANGWQDVFTVDQRKDISVWN